MSLSKALLVAAALLPLALATPVPTATTAAPSSTITPTAAPEQTHYLHPNGDDSLCLSVVNPANDAPTQILPCIGGSESGDKTGKFVRWVFVPGDNLSVRLEGFELCLDAGSTPGNNGPAKVYECYPGVSQQHWYYTGDNRLAIAGGDQCLDRTGGNGAPQTYQCTTGNTNQAWTTTEPNCAETNCGLPDTIAPTTTSCAETNCGIPDVFTASATLTVSDPTVTAAAPEQTHLIHPGNDDSLCLAVVNPKPDAPTQFLPCAGAAVPGDETGKFAHWVFIPGDNLSVRLEGFELCLDAGSAPGNNGPAKVYTCYPGLAQQHWYYTNDNRLALTGGNQCLDRASGNGAPQTYECTAGNTNQVFVTTDVDCAETNCGIPDAYTTSAALTVTSFAAHATTSCAETNCGLPDVFTTSASLTVIAVPTTSCAETNCGIPDAFTSSAIPSATHVV